MSDSDPFKTFMAAMVRLRDVPPRTFIMAHHSVPYGRVYRQWDTQGHLLLWVNRGLIADLPRATVPGSDLDIAISYIAPPGLGGIPVINA
jgi:hypothetical protein